LDFQPRNILIINFGQLGDVILSLPAFRAVRVKFPKAKITAMVGKSGKEAIELSRYTDDVIAVDRAELRRRNPVWSVFQIFKLVADVRRRKFDFVIDLVSYYETNQLGFVSGAKWRLYRNRESRSLDFLSNFRPKPPLQDKTKHATDQMLDVLKPLGIENADRFIHINPPKEDLEFVEKFLGAKIDKTKRLVGIFPGAGHASRRWRVENFAELSKLLMRDERLQTIVFLGPEEAGWREKIEGEFPAQNVILDKLTLPQLAAAMSRLEVLISNDTGAMHVGAVAGAAIVLILHETATRSYLPMTEKLAVVSRDGLDKISVEEVFRATQNFLTEKP
jgi:ADP-heptose:LPS heptosyltransferase